MSVERRGKPEAPVHGRGGAGGVLAAGALLSVLLAAPAAAVGEPPAAPADVDPCATTNPDGSPKEPDPMCQSGLPVDAGSEEAGDVLPMTGPGDRVAALAALGAGLVAAGGGAVVAGRRRRAVRTAG